jgi:hypothetical protein
MSEQVQIVVVVLLVLATAALGIFLIWRFILQGELSTRSWAVRLPVYLASYHIASMSLGVLFPKIFASHLSVVNPVYAITLHFGKFFEQLLHAIGGVINIGNPAGGMIFMLVYILVVAVSLWALVGVMFGSVLDLAVRIKRNGTPGH